MKASPIRNHYTVAAVFLLLLSCYLGVAWLVYAPRDYYERDGPRLSDPWKDRTKVILRGENVYIGTKLPTTTPPLSNYLLVIPTAAALQCWANPWATFCYMLYFSAFCLFSAWLLAAMGQTPRRGLLAAITFLLSPLTLGNAVLRRQDEAILVFFVGAVLYFMSRRRRVLACVTLGAALLVKLGAVLLIPFALLYRRKPTRPSADDTHALPSALLSSIDWHYVWIPLLVFLLGFAPFWLGAWRADNIRAAIIWDSQTRGKQHLKQLAGLSPWNLVFKRLTSSAPGELGLLKAVMGYEDFDETGWDDARREHEHEIRKARYIRRALCCLALALALAVALVAWRRFDMMLGMSVILATALLLTTKLHVGYFSLLAFTLAPPACRKWYLFLLYVLSGGLLIRADFCKFPNGDMQSAAMWMAAAVVTVLILLTVLVVQNWQRAAE